jgi:hypothetical protein
MKKPPQDPHDLAKLPDENRARLRARWKRGLHFRADWGYLVYLLKYTDSVDPEGVA